MGQRQRIRRSRIKITDEQAVLDAALVLMDNEDELGRGRGGDGEVWFSWMNRAEPDSWETGFDAFEAWGFPLIDEVEGEWTEVYFTGEKVGQEELFFDAVSPYVEGEIVFDREYSRTPTTYNFD